MRSIDVTTDVFALIWANRVAPESSENEILERILRKKIASASQQAADTSPTNTSDPKEVFTSKKPEADEKMRQPISGKIRWVDDVEAALIRLGGVASLAQIYKTVEAIRRTANRSTPASLEATIRRTIEDHSSDSDNFRGADLFKKTGRGEWALR